MDPITAVIITFNEDRNIGRCLDSLRGAADEIIVVDSGSTDRTRWIAKDHGARVFEHSWEGYGAQKNFGNGLATHSYILSLDADEALSDELRASINMSKQSGLHGVYGFARLANYCGQWIRHGGWYPDRKIRLFPGARVRWAEDPVHEGLEIQGAAPVTWLAGDLLHYTCRTREEYRDRTESYARLGAEKVRRKGQSLLFLRSTLGPRLRFLKMYVWKRGYLDGPAGYEIAEAAAAEVRLKYRLARGGGVD